MIQNRELFNWIGPSPQNTLITKTLTQNSIRLFLYNRLMHREVYPRPYAPLRPPISPNLQLQLKRQRLFSRIITTKIDRSNVNPHTNNPYRHNNPNPNPPKLTLSPGKLSRTIKLGPYTNRPPTVTTQQPSNSMSRAVTISETPKIERPLVGEVKSVFARTVGEMGTAAGGGGGFRGRRMVTETEKREEFSPEFGVGVLEGVKSHIIHRQTLNDKSRPKKKLDLACKVKSLNFGQFTKQSSKSWYDPLLTFFTPQNQGCTCQSPCPWRSHFIRWAQSSRPRDSHKHYCYITCLRGNPQTLTQIDKDVRRTQPNTQTFQNQRYLHILREVLVSYSKCDPEVGYVQGMNIILSGIVYHVKEEEESFWVFEKVMRGLAVREMFLRGFEEVFTHVREITKCLRDNINDLYLYLLKSGIELQSVLIPWLLSLFLSLVPLHLSHHIYEGFIKSGWPFIYRLATTYLLYLKEQLFQCQDSTDMLVLLSTSHASRDEEIPWGVILGSCDRIRVVAG